MKSIQISVWEDGQSHSLQQWQFSPPTPIHIGRSPEQQVVIDRPSISRLHATISFISLRHGGGYWELSNQSANGTLVNGLSIDRVLLTDGDRIQFAQERVFLLVRLDVAPIVPPPIFSPAKCQHENQEQA